MRTCVSTKTGVYMGANEHLIGLETDFISIFRASRKLRMCVVYVYVRTRTFDWLHSLKLSSFDGFNFSRACTFY